jgi:hypothetical protein
MYSWEKPTTAKANIIEIAIDFFILRTNFCVSLMFAMQR